MFDENGAMMVFWQALQPHPTEGKPQFVRGIAAAGNSHICIGWLILHDFFSTKCSINWNLGPLNLDPLSSREYIIFESYCCCCCCCCCISYNCHNNSTIIGKSNIPTQLAHDVVTTSHAYLAYVLDNVYPI